jgi:hypothetical protein
MSMKTTDFPGLKLIFLFFTAAVARATVAAPAPAPEPLKPVGEGKGIHPGRVVWVRNAQVVQWKGPGDGHWWDGKHISQDQADAMMARSVCELTGEPTAGEAWKRLFRHFNKNRGKGARDYKTGEKIAIKPNWVGMIYREGAVNEDSYTLQKRQDYMNTSPQMIMALLKQLTVTAGVKQTDITVCDTLSYLVNEYYEILHSAFPEVRYEDYGGRAGRVKVSNSSVPLYWSCRPEGVAQDYLPTCFAEADYLINFASMKAHTAGGVTLCAKNHYGSLVRWPVEKGYFDMHPACFSTGTGVYRPLVDLMGHAQLGGKTLLYLIDGLFCGVHPIDQAPRRVTSAPYEGQWLSSLLASQDPVAIDSVAFDFLWTEYADYPRKGGVDDYLCEAALANHPPSGTFYDPDHPKPTRRLPSLGVHEHWNNAEERKYSRNLGKTEGIELLPITMALSAQAR